jgi:hypothetical protein
MQPSLFPPFVHRAVETEPRQVTEFEDRQAKRDRVAAYFKSHPNVWIGRETLIEHGSGSAPQTRVSECKLELKMRIESRPTTFRGSDGKTHRGFQEYRYVTV